MSARNQTSAQWQMRTARTVSVTNTIWQICPLSWLGDEEQMLLFLSQRAWESARAVWVTWISTVSENLWNNVEPTSGNYQKRSPSWEQIYIVLQRFIALHVLVFYLFITTASDSSSEEYIKIRPVAKQHGATALSPRCRDYNELWTRRIDGQHVFWIHSHHICQSALLIQLLTEGARTSEGGLCYINPGITPTSDTKGCENEAHHI